MENDARGKFCSFCATPAGDGTRLCGGHGAWICEQCARRFAAAFDDRDWPVVAILPSWQAMSDADLLRLIPEIVATGVQHDAFLRDWVDMLRERRISWHRIGLALGVSRQAVWQRFTRSRAGDVKSAAGAGSG